MTLQQIEKALKKLQKQICCNTVSTSSASNGLSINSISGHVVLGNDLGDSDKPALITSTREIFMDTGTLISLKRNDGVLPSREIQLDPIGRIQIYKPLGGNVNFLYTDTTTTSSAPGMSYWLGSTLTGATLQMATGYEGLNNKYFLDMRGTSIEVTIENNGVAFASWRRSDKAYNHFGGVINVGTQTSVASAALQVVSTTKGFLPPKMTTAQKNAIVSPVSGLIVYDTTLNKLCVFTTVWETITSS